MPRMAIRGRGPDAGAGRGFAATAAGRNRRAARVDPADVVDAIGGSGWTMPDVCTVTASYRLMHGDRVATVVAEGLRRAGFAVGDEPDSVQAIRLAMTDLIQRYGGDSIREVTRAEVMLTGTLDPCSSRNHRDVDPANLYLTLEPSEAEYLVLGPTLRALGAQHPRLPATFYQLFTRALNRWIRAYDYRDALEHVERLRDWFSADPDCEKYEVPDVEASVPASVRERPLRTQELNRLLPSLSAQVRELMTAAMELDCLSQSCTRPRFTETIEEQLGDCNPPLPCLLIVFSPGDNIEACFDEESQGMLELCPEPNLVIPMDATKVRSVKRAMRTLATMCEVLGSAGALIRSLKEA